MDEERAEELATAERDTYSPAAAAVMDVYDMPLASEPENPISAHLVLGWDDGRGSVTDFGWDYLPRLGYALRDPTTHAYILHEERDGLLHPIDAARAHQLDLLDSNDRLVRHGQPMIIGCENVRPFLDKYVDADCVFSTGNKQTLMTIIEGDELPSAEWFVGKRPMDVRQYPSNDLLPEVIHPVIRRSLL